MAQIENRHNTTEFAEHDFHAILDPEQIRQAEQIEDWVRSTGARVEVNDPDDSRGYHTERGRRWESGSYLYEVTHNFKSSEMTLVRAEINPDDSAIYNGEKLIIRKTNFDEIGMAEVTWDGADNIKRQMSAEDRNPQDFTLERATELLGEFESAIHKTSRVRRIAYRAGKVVSSRRAKA
jgi:hypothetical protein